MDEDSEPIVSLELATVDYKPDQLEPISLESLSPTKQENMYNDKKLTQIKKNDNYNASSPVVLQLRD